MHPQRALFEIVHDVVSHLDAGLSEFTISHDEIADALGTPSTDIVQRALEQICLANDFAASYDAEARVWTFRKSSV